MTKVKWGFSLILVFFIVGILSTVAFAASVVYTLKAVQNGSGLEVSFTGNPADVGGYNLLVKDGSNNTIQTDPITLNSSYIGTLNITGLTVGNTYTLQLYKQSDSLTLLSKASVVITDGNNASVPNSNQTGYRNLKKQRVGQNMHGFYQNNTNSCATCHQTHTAKNGNALLFKDGVYDTCTACHDGTTAASIDSVAGTFNVSDDVDHGSFHQADGSLQVSAAPGGHKTLDTTGMDTTTTNEATTLYDNTWGSEFDCASCHNPHGGGSMGENNLNEDPLGWGTVAYKSKVDGGTADQQNGKLFTGRTIYTPDNMSSATDTYILVKTTASAIIASDSTNATYLYKQAGLTDNSSQVIQTYRWNGSKYVPDYSLWLRSSGYGARANTVLYKNGADYTKGDSTNPITVAWQNGFAWGSGVANVTTYDLSVGINVEGSSSDAAAYYDSKDPNYIPYSGTEMSLFCASCHTDYLSAGASTTSGVYTQAHRHRTDEDSLSCVRCHYAHGSDAQIMQDANNNSFWNLSTTNPDGTSNNATYTSGSLKGQNLAGTSPNGTAVNTMSAATALQYLADTNPSSAIKRYTGMSACYGCHGSGEQFMGNPNTTVDSTTGQGVFAGHTGDEGSTGYLGGSRPNNATRH